MTENYSIIVKFFQDGGLFLFPIGLVLALGIIISLERWFYLAKEKYRNAKAFDQFLPLLRTTDMEKMFYFTRENSAPITRIIGCGLDMMKVSSQRGDIENSMSEGILETIPRLEQRTGYLSVLANVATLLGLLGTIIGLIGAFTAVASADPAEKSRILSESISVAMNTTAFGLIAAIPLLVMHAILRNKTQKITNSIEMASVKFLNIMTVNKLIQSNAPRTEFRATDNAANLQNTASAPPQQTEHAKTVSPEEQTPIDVTEETVAASSSPGNSVLSNPSLSDSSLSNTSLSNTEQGNTEHDNSNLDNDALPAT
jgi:biopolymer transport protein ExbB